MAISRPAETHQSLHSHWSADKVRHAYHSGRISYSIIYDRWRVYCWVWIYTKRLLLLIDAYLSAYSLISRPAVNGLHYTLSLNRVWQSSQSKFEFFQSIKQIRLLSRKQRTVSTILKGPIRDSSSWPDHKLPLRLAIVWPRNNDPITPYGYPHALWRYLYHLEL